MSALESEAFESRATEVRRLAFPAIASSLLQTLVFIVDRVMLGQAGESALASMQLAGPFEWSVWSVFSAFTVGTVARVGRHVGAKNPEGARHATRISLAIALASGIVVASLAPIGLPSLGLAYPKASLTVIEAARGYLSFTLGASPVIFLGTAATAALQGSGDTKTPLLIGALCNAIHIPMNRVFILGAGPISAMGARGAGLSTSITFSLIALLGMAALLRKGRPVSLRGPRAALGGPSETRAIARIAVPAVLERVLYHAGYVGFVVIIAELGDAAMAANQALISVESLCFLSADGFGVAAAALVAQKLGAGRPGEAEEATRISAQYAILLLTVVGIVFLFTRRFVMPAFSDNADVITIGVLAVPVLTFAQPFMATSTVLAEALRGGGYTRAVLAVSAVCAFVVRLSATYFFAISLGLGLRGVWLGSTADWIVRTVLLVVVARSIAKRARADQVSDKARG